MKKILLLTIALLGLAVAFNSPVGATSGFNAGRIIDDFVFTNKSTMTVNDIQNFLNSKVPTCDTNGAQQSEMNNTGVPDENGNGSIQRWEWAKHNYGQTTFPCLRNYTQDGISAAQLIYNASQNYSINPQVLIVLLQKEQGLVTDTWPLNVQYRSATGYGCPDTAACDSQYYGLKNQLNWAATMFRAIMNDSPTWYTPYELGDNYIQYNPNASCGGSTVNVQNRSTQALYNYTPYQPSQAALDAGWGTVNCGAYGNRNFYLYFTNWFGSTLGVPQSNINIPDGTYSVINQASNRVTDVTGGQTSNGTAIQIYNPNNTAAQKWHLERDSEGYYSLKNVASGRYLDVINGSRLSGASVQIWDGNSTCAQKWALVTSGDKLHILNKCSGLSLDVTGGQLTNGAKLQIWNKNTSSAQLWKLVSHDAAPVNNGFYEINAPSGLSLEISGGSTANGTQLQLWNSNKSPSQYWQITRQSDGLYTIRNPASGRYMDVINASVTDGAGIQIFNGGPTCAQRWVISGTSSSGLTLQSSCSDKVIDVVNADITTPGAKVQIWDSNGTAAQKWHLVKQPINPPDGLYSLLTNKGLSLEISGGSTANGTQLQLWNSNKSPSQYWQITRQSDGLYTIRNPASGRYMDVAGGKITSSTPIHIWNSNNFCPQKWSIQDNNNGTFTILSACSNSFALDVTSGSTGTPGTKIQLYSKNGSGAQSWIIGTP